MTSRILRFFFWWELFWLAWCVGWATYQVVRGRWLWALFFVALGVVNVALMKINLRQQRRWRELGLG